MTVCLISGCGRQSSEDFTPPAGWTPLPPKVAAPGLTALFVGQLDEGDGFVSAISVACATTATQRNKARDFIGAYLDSFWRVDTNLFMGQKLEALRILGHTVLYDNAASSKSAPAMGTTHTYFIMTEAGVYVVTYRTLSQKSFNISQLLEKSLHIKSRDAPYAEEMARYWIDALARVQWGFRTNAAAANHK